MGWRERDYARLRDDERHALFGGGTSGSGPTRRSSSALMLAVAISAVATFVAHQYFRLPLHLRTRGVPAPETLPTPTVPPAPSNGAVSAPRSNVVSIRW